MAAPARINDLVARPENGASELVWTKPANGGSPITDHQVRIDGREWVSTGSADAGYTWPDLVNGREVAFEARAVNADGEAPASNIARTVPRYPPTDMSNDPKSLLPPNASKLERGLEQSSARVVRVPVPIADVWNPARCPESVLPWLAWALSVDRWDPGWPTATKRQVVAGSIGVHKRKGTLAAVEQVLRDIGAVFDIVERPNGAPFTMTVEIHNSGSILIEDIARVVEQIEAVNRRSVHFTVTHNAGASLGVVIGAGVGAASVADLTLEIAA